jgi:hypothetical protein
MLVRVTQPMYVGGVRREVGDTVDLPYVDAMGAIHRGRAARIPEEVPAPPPPPEAPKPPPAPMTTESAPEIVSGKKRKYAPKE